MRTMQLCWNEGDDAVTVAKNFIVHNKLSEDAYEEVKNFILDASFKGGDAIRRRKAAAAAAATAGGNFSSFPSRGFLDVTAVDWKKVWPKLVDVNKGVPAEVQLSEEEVASLRAVVDVLEQTSRYHASTVPRKGVSVLLAKAARWPVGSVFPALDVLRVLVIHADGARALEESAASASASFIDPVLAAVRAGKASAEARPALLLAARALINAFRHESTRRLLVARAEEVLDCVGDLLAYDHATVRYAAAGILHNLAHAWSIGAVDADKAGKPRETGFDGERAQQGAAVAHEALGRVSKDDPETGGLALVLVALGTLLTLGAPVREFARGLSMDAAVKAAMPAAGAAKATAEEVLKAVAV
jgi:phospholipase A-2-activating protein